MKKFICVLVSVLCLLPFGLTACSSSDNGLINLADCEIGYELPVYPDCEFDYVVTKYAYVNGVYSATEYATVHISSIKITLAAINEIQPNEILTDSFSRFVLILNANGTTDKSLAGKTLSMDFYQSNNGSLYGYNSETISENGDIVWHKEINVAAYTTFSFAKID